VAGERQLPAPHSGSGCITVVGADGSTPTSGIGLSCGTVPGWVGKELRRLVRSRRIRGRLDPGPLAYRAIGSLDVGHSRRRGGEGLLRALVASLERSGGYPPLPTRFCGAPRV
jgi:hypothetical protein